MRLLSLSKLGHCLPRQWRTLWRELSRSITADDLNNIEVAIDRCDGGETDPQTQEIRRILAAQRNNARRP